MTTATARLNALWDSAQARKDAGESPRRHAAPLAYSIPPGDGDITARDWFTESELDQAHELGMLVTHEMRCEASAARDRLLAKHAARKTAQ